MLPVLLVDEFIKTQFMVTAWSYIIDQIFLINLDKVLVGTVIIDRLSTNSSVASHKRANSLQMGLNGEHSLKDCRERI